MITKDDIEAFQQSGFAYFDTYKDALAMQQAVKPTQTEIVVSAVASERYRYRVEAAFPVPRKKRRGSPVRWM